MGASPAQCFTVSSVAMIHVFGCFGRQLSCHDLMLICCWQDNLPGCGDVLWIVSTWTLCLWCAVVRSWLSPGLRRCALRNWEIGQCRVICPYDGLISWRHALALLLRLRCSNVHCSALMVQRTANWCRPAPCRAGSPGLHAWTCTCPCMSMSCTLLPE